MVQQERGLDCRCICPNCFFTCAACMGTPQQPLTKEDLTHLLSQRARLDAEREESAETDDSFID